MPVLVVTVPLMGARKTNLLLSGGGNWPASSLLARSSLPGPAWISRLVLMLLGTVSVGGSQKQGAGETSEIPPSAFLH